MMLASGAKYYMINFGNWFQIALVNFLIAGIYGVTMRLAFVVELNCIDFRNVLHGHSHVAMLGWLYISITLLFVNLFISKKQSLKSYKRIMAVSQISVIGMAISFPLQGYGAFSIAFSTLHVLVSYFFVFQFFKDSKLFKSSDRPSLLFAKTALLFMVLSTLALFAMAPIMILDLRSSNLYFLAVQFFLHFQFNGWFIFAAIALFFKVCENWNIEFSRKKMRCFYWALVISCFLTFALAVTWSNPSYMLFSVNSVGVIIQSAALVFFFLMLRTFFSSIANNSSKLVYNLFFISFLSFALKILIQSAVVLPFIAKIGYTIRNYVIGFIHLILLATITFTVLAIAYELKFLRSTKNALIGLYILVTGIILSEFLLFFQGTSLWLGTGFIPLYYELIFCISLLMPVGIAILLISQWRAGNQV